MTDNKHYRDNIFSVYLYPEDRRSLDRLAKSGSISKGEVIRRALKSYEQTRLSKVY